MQSSIGSCPGCRIVVADLCLLSAIKLIIILTTCSALRIKEGEWMEDIILCGQYRSDHLLYRLQGWYPLCRSLRWQYNFTRAKIALTEYANKCRFMWPPFFHHNQLFIGPVVLRFYFSIPRGWRPRFICNV